MRLPAIEINSVSNTVHENNKTFNLPENTTVPQKPRSLRGIHLARRVFSAGNVVPWKKKLTNI
jgi:hypothetical protein